LRLAKLLIAFIVHQQAYTPRNFHSSSC